MTDHDHDAERAARDRLVAMGIDHAAEFLIMLDSLVARGAITPTERDGLIAGSRHAATAEQGGECVDIWPGWVESHGGAVLRSGDGERLAAVHRDSWWRWIAGGRGGSVATMAAAQLAAQDALVGLEGEIRAARGAP